MSERLSIVVPDGTIEKLKQQAEENGHTQSSFGRKLLLDGLKKTGQLVATIKPEDFSFTLDRNNKGGA